MINLELFSGAGGLAEGFRRASVKFDVAIDIVGDHCDSYARNLGHRPVQMDVCDLLRLVRVGWRVDVGLLVADPPCTPWSRAGSRRGVADDRDMLEQTCELIARLRPQRYLIGNVLGLQDSNNWEVVQRVIGGLAEHDYCVADYAVLDAANYGVAQRRLRPFWFGHRTGPCIRWPVPTHCDPADLTTETLPGVDALLPWVTCRQALGQLLGADLGRRVRLPRRKSRSRHRLPEHASQLDAPARTITTQARATQHATTIITDPPVAAIQLSERATAILQGFSESWYVAGRTKKARWGQIAMAMPPPLAEAIARAAVEQESASFPAPMAGGRTR